MTHIHDTPLQVTAADGVVHVTGPAGATYSFTPEAAADTSERLLHGAAQAQGQRIQEKRAADEQKANRYR